MIPFAFFITLRHDYDCLIAQRWSTCSYKSQRLQIKYVPSLMFFRNTATRAKVVEEWAQDGGVLLMGYEMYRLLSLKKSFVAGRKKKNKKTGPVVIDLDEEDRQQELLKGGRPIGKREDKEKGGVKEKEGGNKEN